MEDLYFSVDLDYKIKVTDWSDIWEFYAGCNWWDSRKLAKRETVPINLKLAWRGHARNRFTISRQNKEGPDDPFMYPHARAGFVKWLMWAKKTLSSCPLKLCWVFSGGVS